MNKRIEELALEVFSFKYKTDPNELNPGHHMDHLHKFAELIVRECIDNIRRVGILEDIENETDMVVNAVKEHFGVKEYD